MVKTILCIQAGLHYRGSVCDNDSVNLFQSQTFMQEFALRPLLE